VEVVPASVGYAIVYMLDSSLGLLPVVGELLLAALGLLRCAQVGSVPVEDVKRRNKSSVRERGKTDHAHVYTSGVPLGRRRRPRLPSRELTPEGGRFQPCKQPERGVEPHDSSEEVSGHS
jgi:hypothetical protein